MRLIFIAVLLSCLPALADEAAVTQLEPRQNESTQQRGVEYGLLTGQTMAVGAFASMTGVLIGAGLGSLAINLVGAAIPVLLANLVFPPLVTVLLAVWFGNMNDEGRFGILWPMLTAFGVNAAVYVVTSLLLNFAVGWSNPVALLLYALVDGVLMGGATVGMMMLTERKPVTITSKVHGVGDTMFIPLASRSF